MGAAERKQISNVQVCGTSNPSGSTFDAIPVNGDGVRVHLAEVIAVLSDRLNQLPPDIIAAVLAKIDRKGIALQMGAADMKKLVTSTLNAKSAEKQNKKTPPGKNR